jgi:hypothetical protein
MRSAERFYRVRIGFLYHAMPRFHRSFEFTVTRFGDNAACANRSGYLVTFMEP